MEEIERDLAELQNATEWDERFATIMDRIRDGQAKYRQLEKQYDQLVKKIGFGREPNTIYKQIYAKTKKELGELMIACCLNDETKNYIITTNLIHEQGNGDSFPDVKSIPRCDKWEWRYTLAHDYCYVFYIKLK